MKERVSFTFDKETIAVIDASLEGTKFRNKSHFVEEAILSYGERLQGGDDYA